MEEIKLGKWYESIIRYYYFTKEYKAKTTPLGGLVFDGFSLSKNLDYKFTKFTSHIRIFGDMHFTLLDLKRLEACNRYDSTRLNKKIIMWAFK